MCWNCFDPFKNVSIVNDAETIGTFDNLRTHVESELFFYEGTVEASVCQ